MTLLIFGAIVESNLTPNVEMLKTNETYAAEQLALYWESREGPYSLAHDGGNTVAFLPLQNLTSKYQSIIDRATSQFLDATDEGIDPVTLGYLAQREITLRLFASPKASVSEFAWNGSPVLPITILKPLSRGSILINSTDPFTQPLVDFGALTDHTDIEIMIETIRKARELMASPAMQELSPIETVPGADLTSDAQLEEVLRAQAQPTYSHPCCTCSMMRREFGGVVGPDLKVYGVSGLSVVDASVMPLNPATHPSSTVYAVAEKVGRL